MPLASPKYPFQQFAIAGAPEDPGVYALYRDAEILCIGVATEKETIRARLLAHFNGGAQRCGVTHYQWEISRAAQLKREEYLRRLAQQYPSCESHPVPPARGAS